MITQFKSKPTQITLDAEQYLRKYTNLDIIISSLNTYQSRLAYVNFFFLRLTHKVTFNNGFNPPAWKVEIRRPAWVPKLPF